MTTSATAHEARDMLSGNRATTPVSDRESKDLLQVASLIGQRLARQAVWHQGRCNWVGASPNDQGRDGRVSVVYRALGPDLYDGTSGVALFLAELYAATGEAEA